MTDFPAPQTARNVPGLLLGLHNSQFSGSVTVSGSPGGTIHLRDGLVIAVRTPGAPTAESTLLKTQRITEADWEAARAAGSAGGDLGAALLARGLIGAAELDIVRTSAMFDGAFAMALSPPGGWDVDDSVAVPPLAASSGVESLRLTDETARRLSLLTELWGPPAEFARTRIRPSARASTGAVQLSSRYQDILLHANGRRTPRDIAFLLGRGVFAVMLDLTRLSARGLVARDTLRATTPAEAVAPRRDAVTAAPPPPTDGTVEPLPRRSPGDRLPNTPATTAAARQQTGAGAVAGILRKIRTDLFESTDRAAGEAPGAERGTGDVSKAAE
jgi:hypothetical protein